MELFISKSSRPLEQPLPAPPASQITYLCICKSLKMLTQTHTFPVRPHLHMHLPTQTTALCCNTKMDKPNLIYSRDNFSTTESFNLKRKTMGFRPGRQLLWLNLSMFLLIHKKSAPTFSTHCLQRGEKDAVIYHRGGSDICEK